MAGLPGRPSAFRTHKGAHGFDLPNIFSPLDPGTRLGSVLQMSDAGRLVAGHINAQHGGASVSNPFGVGQLLYGRGMASQWVSESYLDRFWRSHETLRRDLHTGAKAVLTSSVSSLVGLTVATGLKAAGAPAPVAGAVGWVAAAKTGVALGLYLSNKEFDPWSGDFYGRRADGGASGDMPTTTPEQSGGHAMSSALLLDTLAEAYRRMQQQAHSPAGPDAAAGGGSSTAPERLFLHGMKHPYDMVAMHRVG